MYLYIDHSQCMKIVIIISMWIGAGILSKNLPILPKSIHRVFGLLEFHPNSPPSKYTNPSNLTLLISDSSLNNNNSNNKVKDNQKRTIYLRNSTQNKTWKTKWINKLMWISWTIVLKYIEFLTWSTWRSTSILQFRQVLFSINWCPR